MRVIRHDIAMFLSEGQFQWEGAYVTNLLVLGTENSSGTSYAERQALAGDAHVRDRIDGLRCGVRGADSRKSGCGVGSCRYRTPKRRAESSTRFGATGQGETTPFTIPFTTHP